MSDDDHPAILLSNRQSRPVDEDELTRLALTTLRGEGVGAAELSISLVEDDEIAELHERYMGEPGPTDVLAFPLEDDDHEEDGVRVLGDVVIAPAVAASNQPERPDDEVRLLLVHGILHLLGYDHEEAVQRAAMWERQERYSGVRAP